MHCACNPRINGIWVVSYMRDNFNPIAIQITNMANLKFFWIIKTIRTPTRERAVPVEIAELGVEKISWEESSNWGWEKGSTHRNKSPIAKNKRERERERESSNTTTTTTTTYGNHRPMGRKKKIHYKREQQLRVRERQYSYK